MHAKKPLSSENFDSWLEITPRKEGLYPDEYTAMMLYGKYFIKEGQNGDRIIQLGNSGIIKDPLVLAGFFSYIVMDLGLIAYSPDDPVLVRRSISIPKPRGVLTLDRGENPVLRHNQQAVAKIFN